MLETFFGQQPERVFFLRQLEVQREQQFYHWITNRAVRTLIEVGDLSSETRPLSAGGQIKLVWHHRFRYYKRAAAELVRLVEEYAHPTVGSALGLHGEFMTLEGFARNRFVLLGRAVNSLDGVAWTETAHNIDLVFERDGVRYGIEVKNTLSYMDYAELHIKIKLCKQLGLRPVFVVRMLPRNWIYEVAQEGGFVLVLKYQLYPWTHTALARRVAQTLGLPVDAPRALAEGTMARFLKWHIQNV